MPVRLLPPKRSSSERSPGPHSYWEEKCQRTEVDRLLPASDFRDPSWYPAKRLLRARGTRAATPAKSLAVTSSGNNWPRANGGRNQERSYPDLKDEWRRSFPDK